MILSPINGSNDVTLLETFQVEKLITDWNNFFSIDVANEFQGYKNIYLYQCNQTKLRFFYPLDVVGSSQMYQDLMKIDWYYMAQKWEYEVALKNLVKSEKILEVGCGVGHFVQSAMDVGLNIKGIELNETAIFIAKKKQLPIEKLDLQEAAEFYSNSLDAICSFQVLEHVPNPKDFIAWSLQMLKPGGKLMLCVPNYDSFLKYQYNLLDMPPHHMLRWCKYTFKSIEKIFPLKLEKVLYEPLADYHALAYLSVYYRTKYAFGKVFFNSRTLPFYEKCLKDWGLRKFLLGQSIYIQYRKL
jgi:2-polyprenyl-3-methyl-5-hydroxy-6-metoxy-1,4-benzoquinol methylase